MENTQPNTLSPSDFERPKITNTAIMSLGILLVLVSVLAGYLIYALWPVLAKEPCVTSTQQNIPCWEDTSHVFRYDFTIPAERRMILLVLLAGALGSLIHAATSFSNYVGDGKLDQKWIWWYILRPIIGMAVAFVFYLVFRGGLISATNIEVLNTYGIITLAALSGLFTDRATLKLKEVFETLFKPKDERLNKLETSKKNDFEDTDAIG